MKGGAGPDKPLYKQLSGFPGFLTSGDTEGG